MANKLYHLINPIDRSYAGNTEIKPEDDFWTLTPYLGNCIKEYHNKLNDVWIETANQSEIQKFILENNLKLETEKYIKRTNDGINAYAKISAEFRLAKLNGIISEEQHSSIEKTLIVVRNEVLAGQWISAKKELEQIGSFAIGVDLYNRLFNQITNYIAENY